MTKKSDWDDFTDDIKEERPGPTCKVCLLIENLPDDARATVEAAMKRREISSTSIRKALLKRLDWVPSAWTLNRHRRGECKEYKP